MFTPPASPPRIQSNSTETIHIPYIAHLLLVAIIADAAVIWMVEGAAEAGKE